MDPIATFAGGVNSSIKILEVTYQLKTVGEQTADLLKTAEHVSRNIDEARRLRRMKFDHVEGAERSWIDNIINDTENALLEVARLIEPARIDCDIGQGVSSRNRVLWVLRDGPKVTDKHRKLGICHQSLTAVITTLHSKDMGFSSISREKEQQPPPYDKEMEALFNWNNRRRGKSVPNLSETRPHPQCAELPAPTISPTMGAEGIQRRIARPFIIPQLTLEPFTTFNNNFGDWLRLSTEKDTRVPETSTSAGTLDTTDVHSLLPPDDGTWDIRQNLDKQEPG